MNKPDRIIVRLLRTGVLEVTSGTSGVRVPETLEADLRARLDAELSALALAAASLSTSTASPDEAAKRVLDGIALDGYRVHDRREVPMRNLPTWEQIVVVLAREGA